MTSLTALFLALWTAAALWIAPPPAFASPWGRQLGVKTGQLLVASPSMGDPRFAQSVVLLINYGPGGSRGLIVNHPTGRDLSADFGDRVRADVAAAPLYYGGPLGEEHRLMLTDYQDPSGGGVEVIDGLYFVHGRRLIGALTQLPEEGVAYRVLAGYAGWAPLQLEHEIARGDWFLIPASRHYVLEMAPEQLWGELMRYYEAQMAWRGPVTEGMADG